MCRFEKVKSRSGIFCLMPKKNCVSFSAHFIFPETALYFLEIKNGSSIGKELKMIMREYRADDLETVMSIVNEAWRPIRQMSREALGDTISDLMNPAGDAKSKGLQVKAQIESGKYGIAVCEHEDTVVGFITWQIDGLFGEICNNGALKASGLKGIGQTMYHYVFDVFRSAGVKVVKVTTGLDWAHAPARRAYERAGFTKHLDSTTYFMELE